VNARASNLAKAVRIGAALLPILAAGCTVGPNYHRPSTPTPPAFRAQPGPTETASIADLPWWGVFNDAALQDLISEGLNNNYDLKIAIARVEQAREQVQIVRSQGLPQLGYQAFGAQEETFIPLGRAIATESFATYGASLNFAWEADVWGKIRRATEAAKATLLQQEYVRRGVMLTLVSDLATDYFQLLEFDRELAISEDAARVYKKTLDLFYLRYKAGRDAKLQVERADANYRQALAAVQVLRRQIGQQENAISTLVGGYPRAIKRGRPLIEQVTPPTPVGATSELLQRRPDILAAEQAMVASNAEIGVAVANFFPDVSLQAVTTGEGVSLSNINKGFWLWNYALTATGPIFTGGRLGAAYRQSKAYWDETIAQYKKTVLGAFQETSDALIAQQTLVGQRAALEGQVSALRRSVDLAFVRYDAGRASYFEVLEAENQLFPAEDTLAQTERDQLLAVVSLYRALGGGWNLPDAQWNRSSR
jgi:multidrug efflux system outer membrane protein